VSCRGTADASKQHEDDADTEPSGVVAVAKRKNRRPKTLPSSAVVPVVPIPPPDDPLKRQQESEPSPERAREMAEARLEALRKLGRIKD